MLFWDFREKSGAAHANSFDHEKYVLDKDIIDKSSVEGDAGMKLLVYLTVQLCKEQVSKIDATV